MARNILKEEGWIDFWKGFHDRKNKDNCTPALYAPTDKLRKALADWSLYETLPVPELKEYHKRSLLKTLCDFYANHNFFGCATPTVFKQWRTKLTNRKHGRVYALGPKNYQQMEDRTQIRIDGKPTAEIDICASHLTGYLSVMKFDFSQGFGERTDLYAIDGLPREVVKMAVMWIFGKGSVTGLHSWYPCFTDAKKKKEIPSIFWKYKPQEVIDRIVKEYPCLGDIQPGDGEDLVEMEAEALLGAVMELMGKDIVALPTHDSILVIQDHLEIAKETLSRHYEAWFGRKPVLKVKMPAPSHKTTPGAWFGEESPPNGGACRGSIADASPTIGDEVLDIEEGLDRILEKYTYKSTRFSDEGSSYAKKNRRGQGRGTITLQLDPQTEKRANGGKREGSGRKRKWATEAERNRAYRERKKQDSVG